MYTKLRAGRALGMAAVVLTLGFQGCVDPVSPYVPVVTNVLDSFEYQVAVTDVTRSVSYTWTTTGNAAMVDLASNVTAGTATVTIVDADTAQVFSHALDGSGSQGTTSATAGDWMVRIKLTNATGTVHFSIAKQ